MATQLDNVLITVHHQPDPQHTTLTSEITDFGSAIDETNALTGQQYRHYAERSGTDLYQAPEQHNHGGQRFGWDSLPTCNETDVYSLMITTLKSIGCWDPVEKRVLISGVIVDKARLECVSIALKPIDSY